ncbi:AraC family transcriptional regulator [Stenotrophomonas sp. ESTM1D_MKCIP4_1]|uniref:helix-turn-helix transcriptional regulator n=1 Tax=Stenotrophomonas sp. ESTM1D_MKCIP4_1 TaxID=2072414 RepID=UPI000D53FCD0|nr:AraC family transcriptional regulator [Stenotrophomonas sp. ESTM1D_MKCIP4_1]AWH53610.1 AraC family transcriptional regulator [Stenotrophomonas sp. ESTM1D_MKCIP4_1]
MPTLAARLQHETGHLTMGTCSSDDGSIVLLRHRFTASEGEMGHPHQLRLGLVCAGGGPLLQRTALGSLQACWRPGQFNLVLPGDAGHYASPTVDLLGIAIDTQLHPQHLGLMKHLLPLAARLHEDPVVAAVLHALWSSAQVHGCLPGFLQHGSDVLLHRLGQLAGQAPMPSPTSAPLSARRLRLLEEYIDAHRADPLDVAALAASVGMQVSAFGRSLRATSGQTPYAFLTRRRMHWAADALAQGRAVTEVALAAGYANPSKFSAAFRRMMGCAPRAWTRR